MIDVVTLKKVNSKYKALGKHLVQHFTNHCVSLSKVPVTGNG